MRFWFLLLGRIDAVMYNLGVRKLWLKKNDE